MCTLFFSRIFGLRLLCKSRIDFLYQNPYHSGILYCRNRHFHDVKRAFNKIGVLLKIKVVQGSDKKRDRKISGGSNDGGEANGFYNGLVSKKADKELDEDDAKKTKKKKKKKGVSNEVAKKRKERKMHEIEGQFDGLTVPSFTGMALNDNMNFTVTSAENVQKQQDDDDGKSKVKKRKRDENSPKKIKKKTRT